MRLNLSFPAVAPSAVNFAAATDDQPARLNGLAVPFGVPSQPSSDGHRYRFTTGPTNPDDLIDVVVEHDDNAVAGRLTAWEGDDTGMTAGARLFNTTRGRDLAVEVGEAVRPGFSIAADLDYTVADDGVRDVVNWTARHLGVVRRPAFTQTAGVTVTASAHKEEEPMTTTTVEPEVVELSAPPEIPTIAELAELVAEHLGDRRHPEAHPLAQFGNFAAFCEEFQTAETERRTALQAAFAVPDQITGENPGVMPPSWRTDVKSYIDRRRPAIDAFGTIGLPPTGMESNWPYLDPALDVDAIIAQQVTEKSELSGVKVKILKANESIKSAGAVSDISYQLILRSSPSYMATYYTVMAAAWARYGEAKFEAKLIAAGTDTETALPSAADADAVREWLFEASADVEDATGAPASTVLVPRDYFIALGSNPDLVNPKYGTQNVAGTASAATLQINVNGLEIKRGAFLTTGTGIVANADTAKYAEDGPKIATEEDVRKLGRDVAVWGMYEDGEVYFPAGIRVYSPQGG